METAEMVASLGAFVEETRKAVTRIAEATARALADGPARRNSLGEIEPLVRSLLGTDHGPGGMLHGAGFVAAPGLLEDAAWWLEWFAWAPQGSRPSVERLVPETDPAGAHFFDYTLMPWYADARDDRAPVITGPYVDYLCTDDYTLTFTEAVIVPGLGDEGFAGVAGADVRVLAVEEAFLGALRTSDRLLAVVNELGRVVLSNSPRLLSGNLVEEVDVPRLFAAGDPSLHVVAGSELGLLDLGAR